MIKKTTIAIAAIVALLAGMIGLALYSDIRNLTTEYGFITIDGQEMEGKYCGASDRRAITCEDYAGHVYQIREYWETE